MKTVLRIWWTLCEIKSGEKKYKRTRMTSNYPNDISVEAAIAELHSKIGQLGKNNRLDHASKTYALAPLMYADIQGWKLVPQDLPKGVLPFFPPELARASLMDSPNPKKKRKKV